ncbi:MAG: hypothetical protein PVJ39_13540 [Gammaproteobacteria bacterium]|jgi:hypothetical protein
MIENKLRLRTAEPAEPVMTKDERYELIAQIAQGLDEFKDSSSSEQAQVWDSSDTDLDFGDFVTRFN